MKRKRLRAGDMWGRTRMSIDIGPSGNRRKTAALVVADDDFDVALDTVTRPVFGTCGQDQRQGRALPSESFREWVAAMACPSSQRPNRMHRYSGHRPHGGMKCQTPVARLG
jgi:hypothetical protein